MFRKSVLSLLTLSALLIITACGRTAEPASEAPAATLAPTAAPTEAAPAAPADTTTAVTATTNTVSAGEALYTVDTAASTIEWYGSKPIGLSESGNVAIREGQLRFNGTELVDGAFVVDMTTIETTTQSGDMKNMLEGHLKSDEFFGVDTYPTATLVIQSVTPTDVENQYTVVGDLTIKETTAAIEFVTDVTVVDAQQLQATAKLVIDRAVYDVRYGSGSFFSDLGDDLISDEMELTVTLVAQS